MTEQLMASRMKVIGHLSHVVRRHSYLVIISLTCRNAVYRLLPATFLKVLL